MINLARYDYYECTHVCEKCGRTFTAHAPGAKYCDRCRRGSYAIRPLKGEKYVPTEPRTSLGKKITEARAMGMSYGQYVAWMRVHVGK